MIVRENPIPPGRYWLDVSTKTGYPAYRNWRYNHQDKVRTVSTSQSKSGRTFLVFVAYEPVERWDKSEGLGFPNQAAADVTSPKDVMASKHEKDFLDQAGDVVDDVVEKAKAGVGIGMGAAVLLLILALSRK